MSDVQTNGQVVELTATQEAAALAGEIKRRSVLAASAVTGKSKTMFESASAETITAGKGILAGAAVAGAIISAPTVVTWALGHKVLASAVAAGVVVAGSTMIVDKRQRTKRDAGGHAI